MALPYPEVERYVTLKCRSRRRGRETKRMIAKRWINRLVGLFDFYHLGADSFKLVNSVASQPLTPIQRQYCDTLATEVLQWCCLPTGLGLLRSGGRCAKFSVILNSISSSSYTNNACSPSLQALTTSALQVDPKRIALPQQAGGVVPRDYLPEPLREHFLTTTEFCQHIFGSLCQKLATELLNLKRWPFS